MAFDRSVRTVDADGRLRIAVTNISKATVNPYYGREIPDAERLGLEPDRIYQLLRHPDELAKGAATFNSIPLLSKHVPVNVDDHQPDLVVGATGTDCEFNAPYLTNSLVIWEAGAIAGVESLAQCELSCAYRYTADMTPGVYDGAKFDGVMRNLIGNHVALVEQGRAGPDVVVADQSPFQKVTSMKLSRTAIAAIAALGAVTRPKLTAAVDFSGAFDGVTKANLKPKALAVKLHALVKPKFAQDVDLTPAELAEIVENATVGVDDMDAEQALDEETEEERKEREEKMRKAKAAGDTGTPEKEEKSKADLEKEDKQPTEKKTAMDAALIAKAEAAALAKFTAIRQAEREVFPLVGEVSVALDSAAAVYKLALDAAGVDTKDVPEAAFGPMVRMLPKARAATPAPAVAMDSSGVADFHKRFPTAVTPAQGF